jgi:hypothetical protein
MRKYFFSLVATVIAIGTFAFQDVEKKAQEDKYVFQFDGSQSGGYSVDNVENESNSYWKYVGKNQDLCGGQNQKACRIEVLGANVDNTTTPTELRNCNDERHYCTCNRYY